MRTTLNKKLRNINRLAVEIRVALKDVDKELDSENPRLGFINHRLEQIDAWGDKMALLIRRGQELG